MIVNLCENKKSLRRKVKGNGCDNERGDSSGGSDFGLDHNRDSV